MLSLQRKQSEVQPSTRETKLRWNVLFKDLSSFGSLSLAQLIVWRVLRRRRKERTARLKRIKLVRDEDCEHDEL
jgi:hypothetical protein